MKKISQKEKDEINASRALERAERCGADCSVIKLHYEGNSISQIARQLKLDESYVHDQINLLWSDDKLAKI